jgi:FkbM family methyltransferase
MGHLQRLKRVALEVLPAPWVSSLAARTALLLNEVELHLLQVLSRREGASVDVGANLGIYTEILRHCSRQVVAVEPHPAMAQHLRRAFSRGVRVVEAALSDTPGRGSIRVPVIRGCQVDTRGSLQPVANVEFQTVCLEVEVLTLDSMDLDDVGFVKIDVEGHELEVVTGGSKLLRASRPRLLVELEERHRSGCVEQMVRKLEQFGYRGFFVYGHELANVAQYDPTRHQVLSRAKAVSGVGSRDYVNNFIFLADEECGDVLPRIRQCLERLGGWSKLRRALELSGR